MINKNNITLQHEKTVSISTGFNRKAKTWSQEEILLSEFTKRIASYIQTSETHEQFMKMNKDLQSNIKDVGGFVGGKLKDGKRLKSNVVSRSMLTLDADTPSADFLDRVRDLKVFTLIYATHKSAPGSERYRVLIVTDRDMTPDESTAVGRKIGEKIGLNSLDDTTFEVSRLMFWPSCSRDVEPYFELIDEDFLRVDEVLAEYEDWTDPTSWPYSSRSINRRNQRHGLKQQDPLTKRGPVGDFCRAYTIQEAIAKFIPEVYLPTGDPNRYTYAQGSTSSGLVIYDNKFAYSHHSTDPAGGKLLNAYDLIRIHLFDPNGEETEVKNHG